MFRCERCGSSYSSMHSVGIENCPRCMLKDRTASPLVLKVFDLPAPGSEPDAGAMPKPVELRVEGQGAAPAARQETG